MKRVAVVIPTFERPVLLLRAIESVRAMRTEGIRLEVIVVDNHSSVDLNAVVRDRFGDSVAVVVNLRNLGMTGNWNRCRDVAESLAPDFWLMLEDDNLLECDFLVEGVARLLENPRCLWFHSAVTEFDDAGAHRIWRPWSANSLGPADGVVPTADLIGWAFATQIKVSALLVRGCDRLRGLPRYRQEHYTAHDVSGLCELAVAAPGWYSNRPLMRYYLNPVSVTTAARAKPRAAMAEMLRALRSNIALLAASGLYDSGSWRRAARSVPVDRLFMSVLSLYGRVGPEVAPVRRELTRELHARRGELDGVAGRVARTLGPLAWTLARFVAARWSKVDHGGEPAP